MNFKTFYKPAGRAGEYSNWAVNLYTTCVHNCLYCYVPNSIRKRQEDFFQLAPPRKGIVSLIHKDLLVADALNFKERVLMCFTCDPWQNIADGCADSVMKVFARFDHPFTILTKSYHPEMIDMMSPERDHYAASLTFDNDRDSLKWEKNASLPCDRLRGLKYAKSRGLYTWASIEPVIDAKQSLEMIKRSLDFVDHYKIGTVSQSALKRPTDWDDFTDDVKKLLSGRSYYLKKELVSLLTA